MSSWINKQDSEFHQIVNKNLVNYTNLDPNYLFEVTQEHFPSFIGTGSSAGATAIQNLCKKLWQLGKEFVINGRRLLTGESFVSFVHAVHTTTNFSHFICFQTRISTNTEKTGKKKGGNRLTLTKQKKKWQKRSLSCTLHARQDCYFSTQKWMNMSILYGGSIWRVSVVRHWWRSPLLFSLKSIRHVAICLGALLHQSNAPHFLTLNIIIWKNTR